MDNSKNESKTENYVRDRLRSLGYYNDKSLIVEEKKSDNPRIDKLLKTASKRGVGAGYPEFIIRSSVNSEFIIVIECKADVARHESKGHDKYADYSVDGALLYASYLSKDFDVLAIGVSGHTNNVKISHYLYLNGVSKAVPVFGDNLLSFKNYYERYLQSDEKMNQDYDSLLKYSQELNETLHAKKIKESQRSLLISAILIALKNNSFKSSYKSHNNAKQLARSLVEAVFNEFQNANIPQVRAEDLKQAFSFITTHTTLSSDKEFFENLISDIYQKIVMTFMQTNKYFDALGQFYIEFLRYANNDKGLGIVLTPPHITELFTDIANVNKNSVILDNCCGTGGFLVSSMKSMIRDAAGDDEKIKQIKDNQLIGIEHEYDIYVLAVSNMIIHGDGKTNIYKGDCFKLVENIKNSFEPDVGILNPPYKSKKAPREELEFIINCLDMLKKNSICVAIVPMSCATEDKHKQVELRRRLMKYHTLEAVMTMPSELFYNSKTTVVTCIMVFTAHVPHPKGKKTWFGYWRNDGFVKRKNRGRIDANNQWQSIKTKWINSYRNRIVRQTFTNKDVNYGFSVMQEVQPEDEWCAEAYLDTDYAEISKKEFESTLEKYTVFKLLNKGLE